MITTLDVDYFSSGECQILLSWWWFFGLLLLLLLLSFEGQILYTEAFSFHSM